MTIATDGCAESNEPQRGPFGFVQQTLPSKTGKADNELKFYVKGEQRPPLILLHELPGLSCKTFGLGDYFVNQGFRVVMPLLFGKAGQANMLKATWQICIQKELRAICQGKDGLITQQIRELAQQELSLYRKLDKDAPGVAVVGMCFTGSMVLALLLNEPDSSAVAAPVMAQPSSGYSKQALDAVRRGEIQGPVLALRFEKDWICRASKLAELETAFAACPAQPNRLIVHELKGRGHSTLVYHYNWNEKRVDLRSPDRQAIDAREAVSAFLHDQLNRHHQAGA